MWRKPNEKWKDTCSFINIYHYNYFITDCFRSWKWHIGYMVPNILSGNWNAVIWKLAAGLGYGVVLSLLRLKTKNCYATVLAHGVLNLFMI